MNSKNLKLLASLAASGFLSLNAWASQIDGEIVSLEDGVATIAVASSLDINKGDPAKVVKAIEGGNFETTDGEVIHTMEGVAIVQFEKGHIDVGLRATIDIKAPFHDADELCAIPNDRFSTSEGVIDEDVDTIASIEACRAAIAQYPDEARFFAQLGRVLEIRKKPAGAILEYEKALIIQPNYPVALHRLASIRFYGPIELRDNDVARNYFNKAAKLGFDQSMPVIGSMCRDGLGGKKDLRAAVQWFTQSADQGYAYSQFALAECYQRGWGVDKDLRQALLLYRSASEKDYVPAMRKLGMVFSEGLGVDVNDEVAFAWFERAAEEGDVEAQYQLGTFHRDGRATKQDIQEGLQCFNTASNEGHIEAKREIAKVFLEGNGVEQDLEIAAAWFLKAAEAGDVSSQYNVGSMYEKGEGLDRDKDSAITWYRKAARSGSTASQKRLIKLKTEW